MVQSPQCEQCWFLLEALVEKLSPTLCLLPGAAGILGILRLATAPLQSLPVSTASSLGLNSSSAHLLGGYLPLDLGPTTNPRCLYLRIGNYLCEDPLTK